MHKLKAVLRSSHKKRNSTSSSSSSPRPSYDSSRVVSPHATHHNASPVVDVQVPTDEPHVQPQQGHLRHHSNSTDVEKGVNNASMPYYVPTGVPALSPADDSNERSHVILGGDRRLITGEGDNRYKQEVADRNIDRHRLSSDASRIKSLPTIPGK